MKNLIFPSKNNIFKTNKEDPIDFYYYPIIGYIYKKRLANTLKLLSGCKKRIMDIGMGAVSCFHRFYNLEKFFLALNTIDKKIRFMNF
jgi:hypothetical protein